MKRLLKQINQKNSARAPLKERFFMTPPLGLMYLASVLRLNGHQVRILDLFYFGGGVERAFDVLKKRFST